MIWNVVFTALLATGISGKLQCKDESGNAVDWFVAYKFPEVSSSDSSLEDGLSYMYMTSKKHDGWTVSSKKIGNTSSIIGQTISPMYGTSSSEALWLVYNDQGMAPQSKTTSWLSSLMSSLYSSTYGHTKGMVGGDKSGGFWLIHSVPHFPGLSSYTYPNTGRRYGQSAICVSMNAKNLDKVGQLLQFNHPDFFKSTISDSLKSVYPNLVTASEGNNPSSTNKSVVLSSKAGSKFQAFGKSSTFGKDLYEWVASTVETDLYVEAWINQANILPSSCSIDHKVMNIASISVEDADLSFTTHQDHSKWAVSSSSSKPWVCVGDINRAVSQEKRGGGTMCTSNAALWKAYKALIKTANEC